MWAPLAPAPMVSMPGIVEPAGVMANSMFLLKDDGADDDDNEEFDWCSASRQHALQRADDAKWRGTPRLGLDFGNVIVANEDDGMFIRRAADGSVEHCSQPCPGAREGVRTLVKLFGREHVFVVSKAGPKIARRSLDWLNESGFLKDTGLYAGEDHVFFVGGRVDKRPIVEALGITHFVDDRMSVLRSLSVCSQRVLMCGPWVQHDDRHDRGEKAKAGGKVVAQSWPEVVGLVRRWFKTSGNKGSGKNTGPPFQVYPHNVGGAASPEFLSIPERCAWLESDLAQLQSCFASLMQAMAQLDADARRLDQQLLARDGDCAEVLAQVAALEKLALAKPCMSPADAPQELVAQAEVPECAAAPPPMPSTPLHNRTPLCAPPAYPAPTTQDLGPPPPQTQAK